MKGKVEMISKEIQNIYCKIQSIEIKRDVIDHIEYMSLKTGESSGITLKNKMVDLGGRLEEGQLTVFPYLKPSNEGSIVHYEDIGGSIIEGSLFFFVHPDNGNDGVCGLRFDTKDKKGNIILVGAAPFSLVFISNLYKEKYLPEYPVNEYVLVNANAESVTNRAD